MTLGSSVVNSLGVAKAQELGKIDERMHVTAVMYFEGSVDRGNTKEDVEALVARRAREKDYKNEAWWAISYSWVILSDLSYMRRDALTTLFEPGFLYLSPTLFRLE